MRDHLHMLQLDGTEIMNAIEMEESMAEYEAELSGTVGMSRSASQLHASLVTQMQSNNGIPIPMSAPRYETAVPHPIAPVMSQKPPAAIPILPNVPIKHPDPVLSFPIDLNNNDDDDLPNSSQLFQQPMFQHSRLMNAQPPPSKFRPAFLTSTSTTPSNDVKLSSATPTTTMPMTPTPAPTPTPPPPRLQSTAVTPSPVRTTTTPSPARIIASNPIIPEAPEGVILA